MGAKCGMRLGRQGEQIFVFNVYQTSIGVPIFLAGFWPFVTCNCKPIYSSTIIGPVRHD